MLNGIEVLLKLETPKHNVSRSPLLIRQRRFKNRLEVVKRNRLFTENRYFKGQTNYETFLLEERGKRVKVNDDVLISALT